MTDVIEQNKSTSEINLCNKTSDSDLAGMSSFPFLATQGKTLNKLQIDTEVDQSVDMDFLISEEEVSVEENSIAQLSSSDDNFYMPVTTDTKLSSRIVINSFKPNPFFD